MPGIFDLRIFLGDFHTPNVEISKLFRLVRDDVMKAAAGRQEPYTDGSLPGRDDFFFAQNEPRRHQAARRRAGRRRVAVL
ncbi:MAG: hypothetical protein K2Z80_34710 [Xanthobacteraceae bacterium]|nr:hypothetical protein [Xanthobacteraceae bacterium]